MTQASQVDAESEREGLQVPLPIRKAHETRDHPLLDFWFNRPNRL